MDIIALPASPLSGAAAPAAPGPSPAAASTGGGFARSLEQAAGAALSPQAYPPRTDTAETPAAPPAATQATVLSGLSRTDMTPLPGGQDEPIPRARALPQDMPADLADWPPQARPLRTDIAETPAAPPAATQATVLSGLSRTGMTPLPGGQDEPIPRARALPQDMPADLADWPPQARPLRTDIAETPAAPPAATQATVLSGLSRTGMTPLPGGQDEPIPRARTLPQDMPADLADWPPQARPLRTDIAETPAAPPAATQATALPGLSRTGMTPLPGGQDEPIPRARALPQDMPADLADWPPQARPLRTDIAETPAAPPAATQATALPGLSRTGMTPLPGGQDEPIPRARALPQDMPADLADWPPQARPLRTDTAETPAAPPAATQATALPGLSRTGMTPLPGGQDEPIPRARALPQDMPADLADWPPQARPLRTDIAETPAAPPAATQATVLSGLSRTGMTPLPGGQDEPTPRARALPQDMPADLADWPPQARPLRTDTAETPAAPPAATQATALPGLSRTGMTPLPGGQDEPIPRARALPQDMPADLADWPPQARPLRTDIAETPAAPPAATQATALPGLSRTGMTPLPGGQDEPIPRARALPMDMPADLADWPPQARPLRTDTAETPAAPPAATQATALPGLSRTGMTPLPGGQDEPIPRARALPMDMPADLADWPPQARPLRTDIAETPAAPPAATQATALPGLSRTGMTPLPGGQDEPIPRARALPQDMPADLADWPPQARPLRTDIAETPAAPPAATQATALPGLSRTGMTPLPGGQDEPIPRARALPQDMPADLADWPPQARPLRTDTAETPAAPPAATQATALPGLSRTGMTPLPGGQDEPTPRARALPQDMPADLADWPPQARPLRTDTAETPAAPPAATQATVLSGLSRTGMTPLPGGQDEPIPRARALPQDMPADLADWPPQARPLRTDTAETPAAPPAATQATVLSGLSRTGMTPLPGGQDEPIPRARALPQDMPADLADWPPQARPLRTDIAETPAAPPAATQATALPGLSWTGMTPLPGGQDEPIPRARALPMDMPADLAARFPQPPLPPRQTATDAAAPAFPDASVSDDLRRIRSLLQTIESAGQVPPPGAAEAALLSQPPQTSPLPLPLTAATTPASAKQSPNQITFASVKPEQNKPTLSTLPRAVGQPELFSNEWTRSAPSEGPRMSEGIQPTIETSPSDGAAPPLVSANPSAGSLAATSNSSMAGSFASTNLTAPLASPDWQRSLGQHLLGLQQHGEQEIELHLHPAELGPLSISLKLGESGAQAQFLSAHPQVRAAVEQAIPQLREALAEQGIALGETSVGERQQQPRDERPGTQERNRALAGSASEEAAPGRAEAVAPARLRLDGVDLYA